MKGSGLIGTVAVASSTLSGGPARAHRLARARITVALTTLTGIALFFIAWALAASTLFGVASKPPRFAKSQTLAASPSTFSATSSYRRG